MLIINQSMFNTLLLLKMVRVWKNVQMVRMRRDRWPMEQSLDTVYLVITPVPPVTEHHPGIASHVPQDTCVSRKSA